ncbi:gp53-like domain-containing protein [Candidatus Binatus sp.]|jgi:hypothetical protein|uniref:gp53-like domain-containing protein n=1 Tax=Candidatus Binatus sp. TaxID=2811406 RepID=UPI003BD54384
MATLIDAAEFTSNEVYQIQATDPVEGAASGASFSGTGISNQPHQQLANRTAFLKQRQDVNISNIGVLQAFQALFTGLMGQNGYLKIPVNDINRGLVQYVIQWGSVNFGTPQVGRLFGPYSFPIAFPNACVNIMLSTLAPPNTTPEKALISGSAGQASINPANPPTTTQFWVWNNNAPDDADTLEGFYWIAIGF